MNFPTKSFTIAISGTTGICELEDWDTLGLIVPTLDSTTLEVQVSTDGTTYYDVQDGTGTQVLVWAAGTGAFAVSSLDMAHVAGYRYLRVQCGSAQNTAARTFTLTRKSPLRN